MLDDTMFVGDQLVIALGVTATGEKRMLGIVQMASEHKRVIMALLRELGDRGFPLDHPLLIVLDGAKGLHAAVCEMFSDMPGVHVQRCQWHKRENVVSYLAKQNQLKWRNKLEAVYAYPLYADAKRALDTLYAEVRVVNESTAASLAEGLKETLTLYRLNIFVEFSVSFLTTNLIESMMARIEARTRHVTCWRTSDQKLRWCVSSMWATEQQFRRVKNYRHLRLLTQALQGNGARSQFIVA